MSERKQIKENVPKQNENVISQQNKIRRLAASSRSLQPETLMEPMSHIEQMEDLRRII